MPPRARRTPARARTLSHAEHVRMSQECADAKPSDVWAWIMRESADENLAKGFRSSGQRLG